MTAAGGTIMSDGSFLTTTEAPILSTTGMDHISLFIGFFFLYMIADLDPQRDTGSGVHSYSLSWLYVEKRVNTEQLILFI